MTDEYIKREAACAYRPPEKRERRYSTYNLDDAFEDGYDEQDWDRLIVALEGEIKRRFDNG